MPKQGGRVKDTLTEAVLRSVVEVALVWLMGVVGPVVIGLSAAIIAIFSPLRTILAQYAQSPIGTLGAGLLVLGAVSAFTVTLLLILGTVKWLLNSRIRQIIISRLGIRSFAAHVADGKEPIWSELKSYIAETPNNEIWIAAATGLETFGHDKSPMREAVWSHKGPVRALLMHPDNPFLPVRARCIGRTETDYRNDLVTMINKIEDWQRQGRLVNFKLYRTHPSWKLIVTCNTAWVQYFTRDCDVEKTPVCLFAPTREQTGLYHMFATEFLRMWDAAEPSHPGEFAHA